MPRRFGIPQPTRADMPVDESDPFSAARGICDWFAISALIWAALVWGLWW